MWNARRYCLIAAVAFACGLAACNSSSSCLVPAAANSGDGGVGCMSTPGFEICQAMDDGSQRCTNQCSTSEYGLGCYDEARPDDALHCKVVPVPTPSGASFYCCPCG
jgi:hypothetical protein